METNNNLIISDTEDKPVNVKDLIKTLKIKEKAWADRYLLRLNKSQASRDLGVSEENCGTYGIRVYNRPAVKAYIEYMLLQQIGVPDDNIRLLRSMADTDLKQYMTEQVRPQQDWIERPLKHLLQDLERDLRHEEEFETMYAETKTEVTLSLQKQKAIKKEIINLKNEIRKKGPLAKRVVLGETYLVKKQVLDLNKICADHENGRIKKYKETKDGIEVELYDAKDAAIQLLKIAGRYAGEGMPAPIMNFENVNVVYK